VGFGRFGLCAALPEGVSLFSRISLGRCEVDVLERASAREDMAARSTLDTLFTRGVEGQRMAS
jgi:hypothetical protein